MFKKFLISVLLILFSFSFMSCTTTPPVVSAVKICSVPKGAAVLQVWVDDRPWVFTPEIPQDLDGLEIVESIPPNVAAELTKKYPGDWSDSVFIKYIYDCPIHGPELVMFMIQTKYLWNCK